MSNDGFVRKRAGHQKKERTKAPKPAVGVLKSFDPSMLTPETMCFKVNEEGERVFDAKVGERVIIERFNSCAEDKRDWDVGLINSIDDDGTVKVWDETKEQWFYFDWQHVNIPLVFKLDESQIKRFSKRKRRAKETSDDAPVQETRTVDMNHEEAE